MTEIQGNFKTHQRVRVQGRRNKQYIVVGYNVLGKVLVRPADKEDRLIDREMFDEERIIQIKGDNTHA